METVFVSNFESVVGSQRKSLFEKVFLAIPESLGDYNPMAFDGSVKTVIEKIENGRIEQPETFDGYADAIVNEFTFCLTIMFGSEAVERDMARHARLWQGDEAYRKAHKKALRRSLKYWE